MNPVTSAMHSVLSSPVGPLFLASPFLSISLGCLLFLPPFFLPPLPNTISPLKARFSLLPRSVYCFLSLLGTLSDGSEYTLLHVYNKNLPLNTPWSSHVLSLYTWHQQPSVYPTANAATPEQS